MKTNILQEANDIVNNRSQEKERQYGPFNESMERAAKIASLMIGKEITAYDMFNCMIAMKLSRQSHTTKTDNLLDACAYIGALQNYINDNNL